MHAHTIQDEGGIVTLHFTVAVTDPHSQVTLVESSMEFHYLRDDKVTTSVGIKLKVPGECRPHKGNQCQVLFTHSSTGYTSSVKVI